MRSYDPYLTWKPSLQFIAMEQPLLSFQWLLVISLICSTYLVATQSLNIPSFGLSSMGEAISLHQRALVAENDKKDFKTFYYKQTLDHFNYRPESYKTFRQRYLINSKYWGGANSSAPIFAFLGAEEPIGDDLENIGFLPENAPSFKALMVYIEHRFYGKSIPFGTQEEALKNANLRGYFNSAQALADYAEVLVHIKKTFVAENSPVIVFGGSYGGSLAAWFRLKYPHLALAALASSAPIFFFDKMPSNAFLNVVAKDYQETSETCHETIRNSWLEIDKVASKKDGLSILSRKFNTCWPLNDVAELQVYLFLMYVKAAQYDTPPLYPVSVICDGIDRAPSGSDIMSKIYAGIVAYLGNKTCKFNAKAPETQTQRGWPWQRCSELMTPMGSGDDSMFPSAPFHIKDHVEQCIREYGVSSRSQWVATYYGGHDIKLVLQRFGSNIIFSNGLRDPFSVAGVLDNLSDSIVAVTTAKGSHCLDLMPTMPSDPKWLVEQREKEIAIIKGWIKQYHADLRGLSKSPKT